MGEKQLLISIRRSTHSITSRQIADKAHLPLSTEYTAEIGGPVSRADAEKVLQAFSELAGIEYTFENVQVNFRSIIEV